VDSSNLRLGFELSWFPIAFGLVCLAAFGHIAFRVIRRSLPSAYMINGAMAAGLFVVAAAPLIAAQQFSTTTRTTLRMTAIELLVLFWLLS
jgi:hypothetical protein